MNLALDEIIAEIFVFMNDGESENLSLPAGHEKTHASCMRFSLTKIAHCSIIGRSGILTNFFQNSMIKREKISR